MTETIKSDDGGAVAVALAASSEEKNTMLRAGGATTTSTTSTCSTKCRDALLSKLRSSGVTFRHSVHAETRTSAESAAVRGTTLSSGAKAILVSYKPTPAQLAQEEVVGKKKGMAETEDTTEPRQAGHQRFALLVMAANRQIHSNRTRKLLFKTKSMSFANSDDVARITGGCLPGAVPPFGSLWGIPTYVDESLRLVDRIDFNCGLRTESVSMTFDDFFAVEEPGVIADFTVPMKEGK